MKIHFQIKGQLGVGEDYFEHRIPLATILKIRFDLIDF